MQVSNKIHDQASADLDYLGMVNLNSSDPMARDTQLWQDYEKLLDNNPSLKPILFFYTWQPAALTIGQIQSNKDKLIKEAQVKNIPYFVRPTGGKAVLHGADICYTFIARSNDKIYGGTLKESFTAVSKDIKELVTSCLKLSELKSYQNCDSRETRLITDNCFGSKVKDENYIELGGIAHKVIGAAQKMGPRSFIQQGSIQVNNNPIDWDLFNSQKSIADLSGMDYELRTLCELLNATLGKDR